MIGSLERGGIAQVVRDLSQALPLLGINSSCIALEKVSASIKTQLEGIDLLDLNLNRRNIVGLIKGILNVRAYIKQRNIDIIHVHGPLALIFLVASVFKMKSVPQIFFTWHNPEFVVKERGIQRFIMLRALQKCSAIFGASGNIVEQLKAIKSIRRSVIGVFPNGVPRTEIRMSSQNDPLRIIWAARLVPTKKPELLIRAAGRLKKEGYRFHVIMAGDSPQYLKWYQIAMSELVKKMNLQETISMPGWVQNIDNLMDYANVGVQTSDTEGLSISLLQMMMRGMAIVATDVGDTSVAIQNALEGLVIPPNNEQALIDALRVLLADPEKRKTLGKQAHEKALSKYSNASVAKAALHFYGIDSKI